ncbi:MAG TPA: DUF1223 domain-containing protein [Parvibaculum sp.]
MKVFAFLALAAVWIFVSAFPATAAARPVVVELFTSQGCSSCPPADAYLRELVTRPDVLPLAFHVDYWDGLGWKDTLDNAAFTARQRGYASALGLSNVYTPQIVIDGASEGVGSDKADIDAKIAARASDAPAIDIRLVGGNAPKLVLAAAPQKTRATLWLIRYRKQASVKIARGENRGETILYMNAVREMKPLAAWTGAAAEVPLTSADLENAAGEESVVILQTDGQGPILGAAHILPPSP